MRNVEEFLFQVDTSTFKTEKDLDDAAEKHLSPVLRHAGEALAAAVWDRCSEGLREAPFTHPEKRAEYIIKAGAAFEIHASERTRYAYRELIVEVLGQKSGLRKSIAARRMQPRLERAPIPMPEELDHTRRDFGWNDI